MKIIPKFLRRWTRREDGTATIEFVIWFPFFIMMMASAFEASILTTRQVLLTGAVDRTVRDLQLGNLGSPNYAELKTILCDRLVMIRNCEASLHVEMERISTADFAFRTGAVQCVDIGQQTEPTVSYTSGTTNDLMLITVCATVSTMIPTTGLGLKLPKVNGSDYYAIVTFSAYVVEPV